MEFDNATIVLILYCILAFVLAFYPAYLIFPRFIRKMKALGNTGKDVNKRGNIQVAEVVGEQSSPRRRGLGQTGLVLSAGGIVAVFSFSFAMFVISGLASISNYHENIVLPLQAATTVFIAAAIIGFIDDWGLLTRRQKAFVIGFSALPLVFLRPAVPQIDLIFRNLDFSHSTFLGVNFLFILFWLVIVPAGILCAANASDNNPQQRIV